VSSSKKVERTFRYGPYGENTKSEGTQTIPYPFGFKSGYRMPGGNKGEGNVANGLYHYGQRYYDPTTGRWTQQDPEDRFGSTTQGDRFLFAGSDPINLRDPSGRVRSAVEVMPTAAFAARDNAVARSARGRACLARALPEQSSGPLRYGPVSVSSLPNVLPGADGSFGLRLTTTVIGRNLRGGEIRTRVYIDAFGFVSGPAEITLTAFGVSRPVPSATEQRLLPLLFSRARERQL
jgi:RHS repeat-associated protein